MTYTLEDIKKKADEEYAPFVIEVDGEELILRNPLRLPSEKRRKVVKLSKQLEEIQERDEDEQDIDETLSDNDEVHRVMLEMIEASADNSVLGKKLTDILAQDIGMTKVLFEEWYGVDDLGEASNSSDD